MNLTTPFKQKVATALKDVRTLHGGTEKEFATKYGMNPAIWSRIKNGETENVLDDNKWLEIGRILNVSLNERTWALARTQVFDAIESDANFCQENSKSMVLVDDCAIGKSFTAKYLSRTRPNCFCLDASQTKTKQLFIRDFARVLGVDSKGKMANVTANIKYYLKMLTKPLVIIDEAGDLDYNAFLTLKEFWNATDGECGWYMMGADGLADKINRGIANKKVGYREILSRYSDKYMKIVPTDRDGEHSFYRQLITDVLSANMKDKSRLPELVKKCMVRDNDGKIGGLRRAETLLILMNAG